MDATDRPDPVQMRIFAAMTAAQKLALVERIRTEALALKEAWLRQQHAGEDEDAIRRRLRAWQLHGHARLD
ncbi:MAG: hypothetical protein DCC71_01670 [Proteobacteria bacterium]|nr:MAG: hypothetical protein DCC71_01670 [Pseudomonadota bacterium]